MPAEDSAIAITPRGLCCSDRINLDAIRLRFLFYASHKPLLYLITVAFGKRLGEGEGFFEDSAGTRNERHRSVMLASHGKKARHIAVPRRLPFGSAPGAIDAGSRVGGLGP